MRGGVATAIDVVQWAATTTISLVWTRGEGDQRIRGWRGADGILAIETNGNTVWSEGDYADFDLAWNQRTLSPKSEIDALQDTEFCR
jgi:hypothetical protein